MISLSSGRGVARYGSEKPFLVLQRGSAAMFFSTDYLTINKYKEIVYDKFVDKTLNCSCCSDFHITWPIQHFYNHLKVVGILGVLF